MKRKVYKKLTEKKRKIIDKSKWQLCMSPMLGFGYNKSTIATMETMYDIISWQFLCFQLSRCIVIRYELEEDF